VKLAKRAALAVLCSLLAASASQASTRIQIILDMSGSMAAAAGKQRKADAAREALATALESIPDGTVVALRIYGHRIPRERKSEGCRDSELVIPFAPIDRAAIMTALEGARPLGQTPIEFSLHEAADDFGPPEETEDSNIILISDGIESCGGNPVKLAKELVREGFKIKIYTVGFDVDAQARKQLEEVSAATGATYTDARNKEALAEAVETATFTAIHGEPVRVLKVVPWAESAQVKENVKQQCQPGAALAEELAKSASNVQLVDSTAGGGSGLVLDMRITEAHVVPGGAFSGTKGIGVEGTLTRGRQVVGSFRDYRRSLGGATGVFKGNCGILEHAARAVARDVAAWLAEPTKDARLGDAP
jgi:hypothetical protein